ncbi:glycoside hydrolase superfamily [Mycena olivaceomarginata]|nr:glycoside hydrolase superfamily [Mycena olivaceomarginata]
MSKDALQRTAPAPPLISSGWYASWVVPEPTISWNKYTTAIYAFSVTTPSPPFINISAIDAGLTSFVAETKGKARNPDLKGRVLLSIGGWTGSIYYSSAVATNASRVAFANAIEDYPGSIPNQSQIGCNQFNPDDSVNFLDFLKTVRSTNVGKDLEITASVGIKPFLNGTGEPMDDVSAFGEVLNRIAVGPNAPLNDACELVQERQQGSAVSAVTAWTNAGFPITLGVASYGRSFFVDPDMALNGQQIIAYPAFNATQPLGPDDSTTWLDPCGNTEISGEFTFSQLITSPEGFLDQNGTSVDNCSQTPYVYDPTSHMMISYDDGRSFTAKGEFISSRDLAGFSMWDLAGDYNNILLNAIQRY